MQILPALPTHRPPLTERPQERQSLTEIYYVSIQWYISKSDALEMGMTHKAMFMAVIPGYFDSQRSSWVSISDLLNPIEDLLVGIWATFQRMSGQEPSYMFFVGGRIDGEEDDT